MTGVCEQCGDEFAYRPRDIREGKQRRYCSKRCTGLAKRRSGVYIGSDGRARVHLRRTGHKQLYSRCVMEAHLGRHLTFNEVVHHINGDTTDDRLDNLALLPRSVHTSQHSREYWQRQDGAGRKLTRAQIEEIVESAEPASRLAERFGVTDGSVYYHRRRILRSQAR